VADFQEVTPYQILKLTDFHFQECQINEQLLAEEAAFQREDN
jgi:hypothetical protein